MIHFLFLVGFAFFVSICFGVFVNGNARQKIIYGIKIFAQFLIISLVLGWLLYFLT